MSDQEKNNSAEDKNQLIEDGKKEKAFREDSTSLEKWEEYTKPNEDQEKTESETVEGGTNGEEVKARSFRPENEEGEPPPPSPPPPPPQQEAVGQAENGEVRQDENQRGGRQQRSRADRRRGEHQRLDGDYQRILDEKLGQLKTEFRQEINRASQNILAEVKMENHRLFEQFRQLFVQQGIVSAPPGRASADVDGPSSSRGGRLAYDSRVRRNSSHSNDSGVGSIGGMQGVRSGASANVATELDARHSSEEDSCGPGPRNGRPPNN